MIERVASGTTQWLIRFLSVWLNQYQRERGDTALMQERADLFMHEFDRVIVRERTKQTEQANVPDQDGWVTVQRRGGKKTSDGTVTVGVANSTISTTRKGKTKSDFYRFQMREERRDRMCRINAINPHPVTNQSYARYMWA
jgi:hypothetical protein